MCKHVLFVEDHCIMIRSVGVIRNRATLPPIMMRATENTRQSATFYKQGNLLAKVHNKNVVYIAYVGKYNGKYTFKYGKSTDVFQREMGSHRKNFELFDMMYIHRTDMKDQVETIFEKELIVRNLHKTLVINNKRQVELFQLRRKSDVHKINDILVQVIAHCDSKTEQEDAMASALKLEEMKLKRAMIAYKLKLMQMKLLPQK